MFTNLQFWKVHVYVYDYIKMSSSMCRGCGFEEKITMYVYMY